MSVGRAESDKLLCRIAPEVFLEPSSSSSPRCGTLQTPPRKNEQSFSFHFRRVVPFRRKDLFGASYMTTTQRVGGSKNEPNLRTNNIDFGNKEGE